MPRYLAAADVGLALRQPSYSQRAVSPIKVAEYLLCGLPVVATVGVGDVDRQLVGDDLGVLLPDVTDPSLRRAADWITSPERNRERERRACREVALRTFAMTRAVESYRRVLGLREGTSHA